MAELIQTRRSSAAATTPIAVHLRNISGEGRPAVASENDSMKHGSFRVFCSAAAVEAFPLTESIRVPITEGFTFVIVARPVPADLGFAGDYHCSFGSAAGLDGD